MNVGGIGGLSTMAQSYGSQSIQGVQAITLRKATDQDKELVSGLLEGNEKRDQYLKANGIGNNINIVA